MTDRLREMLSDPGSVVVERLAGSHRIERQLSPPSQVAFDVLAELEIVVPKPVGHVDDFPYAFVWSGSAALSA